MRYVCLCKDAELRGKTRIVLSVEASKYFNILLECQNAFRDHVGLRFTDLFVLSG